MSKRGSRTWRATFTACVAFNSLAVLASAEMTFRHEPPACMVADAFPRLVVQVDPAGKAARVRVAFRPEAGSAWYGVVAEAGASGFTALLPRPRPGAQKIHYRFEATGPDAAAATSPEYTAVVVESADACAGAVAETLASASVLVDVPPGAPMVPPVPPGFDPVGAVSSAPHKGSSKKKVGVLAGVVIGAGAVAAGVAAGGSESSTPSTMLQPAYHTVQSPSHPYFSEVSVAANNMTLDVVVSPPRTLAPGEAWVILYNPSTAPAERPCAVLAGPHPQLEAGRAGRFVARTPFLHAVACGQSTFARIVFRTTSGQQLLQSGGADWLDASAVWTFVP